MNGFLLFYFRITNLKLNRTIKIMSTFQNGGWFGWYVQRWYDIGRFVNVGKSSPFEFYFVWRLRGSTSQKRPFTCKCLLVHAIKQKTLSKMVWNYRVPSLLPPLQFPPFEKKKWNNNNNKTSYIRRWGLIILFFFLLSICTNGHQCIAHYSSSNYVGAMKELRKWND